MQSATEQERGADFSCLQNLFSLTTKTRKHMIENPKLGKEDKSKGGGGEGAALLSF